MFARARFWKLFLIAALLSSLWTTAALAESDEDIYFDVVISDTGSATIHAGVYNNPMRYRGFVTILAVHGWTEVGSMFEPLVNAIYEDPYLKWIVKRVVSIDMPARSLSSPPTLPEPLTYGDMLIEDNAGIVIQSIDALRAMRRGPQVIMGHSLGGLTVQAVQEMLLSQGSSLAKHGVYSAVLLAALPARGTVWTQLVTPDLTPFIRDDEELGTIVDIPVLACGMGAGFITLSGTTIPAAPSIETCIMNGWGGPEPITLSAQIQGTYCLDEETGEGLCRPFVREGAFAPRNGTILTVVSFSQDVLAPSWDQDELYTYLTGLSAEGPWTLYKPVVADDAVHSMFISNPTAILDALRPCF
jgi:pimeloyl-ACP methyl ester carboxylesterase